VFLSARNRRSKPLEVYVTNVHVATQSAANFQSKLLSKSQNFSQRAQIQPGEAMANPRGCEVSPLQ